MRGLTRLQRRVVRTVLAATEPYGFALAGGAAMVIAGVSPRPTDDIDAFTRISDDVRPAADAVQAALEADGYAVARELSTEYFVRLMVTAGTDRRRRFVKVELGRDHFEWPPLDTPFGPVASPRELAANKVLAAFGRSATRDVCDLATLASQFDLEAVLADAKTKDPGLSRPILADMIHTTLRQPDDDWPPGADIEAIREFAQRLVKALDAGDSVHDLAPRTPVWPDTN